MLTVALGWVCLDISVILEFQWSCLRCIQVFRGFMFTVFGFTVSWEACMVCGFVSCSFSVRVLWWRDPSPGLCYDVEGLSCLSVRWKLASHFKGIFADKRSCVCCQSQHWSGAGCTVCVSPVSSWLLDLFTSSVSSPCKIFTCLSTGLFASNVVLYLIANLQPNA